LKVIRKHSIIPLISSLTLLISTREKISRFRMKLQTMVLNTGHGIAMEQGMAKGRQRG
jgi:hypothetical protein